jgi:uncharacterized membrane protein (DUF2068 family)
VDRRRSDAMLRAIGVFKWMKATTLLAFGGIVLAHLHSDIGHVVRRIATELGFAESNRRIADLIQRIGVLEAAHGLAIGIGAFAYGALFAVEGTGLFLRKLWGEYVAIVITTSFLPLELYELVERESWVKGVILLLNVAIVLYLVLRLRADGHWPFARRRATENHHAGEALGDATRS